MGNDQDNSERIVRVETEVKTTFEWFKDVLVRIESKLDSHADKYVTKESLQEALRSRDEKDTALQKQINDIREEKRTHKSILPLWIAVVPSTILVIMEIIKLTGK